MLRNAFKNMNAPIFWMNKKALISISGRCGWVLLRLQWPAIQFDWAGRLSLGVRWSGGNGRQILIFKWLQKLDGYNVSIIHKNDIFAKRCNWIAAFRWKRNTVGVSQSMDTPNCPRVPCAWNEWTKVWTAFLLFFAITPFTATAFHSGAMRGKQFLSFACSYVLRSTFPYVPASNSFA